MRPPLLPGLTYVSTLGSGGYADVHAYDQRLPARRVAVKVLRDAVGSAPAVAAFVAEANAMARLDHPHIVAVHAAGITADGRPYLVMALHPFPTFATRAGELEVAEVLRVGVQLGGAVETAHAAGLLHRDIKPANVLTSQYGTPVLTDFGLAGTPTSGDPVELGVSVPWAPPETLFATAPASVRSDVYALAATLWTFLAGHAPYEQPGGDNSPSALLRRVRAGEVAAPGPAFPSALASLLGAAVARRPDDRPGSAADLVNRLQSIEASLGLAVTPAVLPTAPRAPAAAQPVRASALLAEEAR